MTTIVSGPRGAGRGADLLELVEDQEAVVEIGDDDRRLEDRIVQHGDRHLERRAATESGMNCFGSVSRDSGHTRVPAPPHMITGKIFTPGPSPAPLAAVQRRRENPCNRRRSDQSGKAEPSLSCSFPPLCRTARTTPSSGRSCATSALRRASGNLTASK